MGCPVEELRGHTAHLGLGLGHPEPRPRLSSGPGPPVLSVPARTWPMGTEPVEGASDSENTAAITGSLLLPRGVTCCIFCIRELIKIKENLSTAALGDSNPVIKLLGPARCLPEQWTALTCATRVGILNGAPKPSWCHLRPRTCSHLPLAVSGSAWCRSRQPYGNRLGPPRSLSCLVWS